MALVLGRRCLEYRRFFSKPFSLHVRFVELEEKAKHNKGEEIRLPIVSVRFVQF